MTETRPQLAELLDYMDETRARLLETAAQVNPAFAAIRPRDGAWSAAETLSHLVKVETGVASMMEKSVQWARAHGIGTPLSDESLTASLDKYRIIESERKRVSPEIVAPGDDTPIEASLEALALARNRLRAALAGSNDIDLSLVKRSHQAIGELDMYQWALFVAQHEERHRRQIDRTMGEVTGLAAESAPIV